MKLLLALLLLTIIPNCAHAEEPDIFIPPPREAFGLGLVLAYEGGVVTVIQSEDAIREACGLNFGCLEWIGEGETRTCQLHIWQGLPDDLEEQAWVNLVARCAGWVPPGE